MIEATIGRIAAGEDLSMEEMADAMGAIMDGNCSLGEIALLLTGLHMKGEATHEIAGAAAALRRHMTPIPTRREGVLDTCGTGGSGSGLFNVSTAAALVAAAAGVPVAKHGNRRATSTSGSADVLAQLGVRVEADVACVAACLDELGICFCFAPLLHASMRHVAEVRRTLEHPTIFNLLGPLANPAAAPFQLLGVSADTRRPQMAEALALLGTRHALVVCGREGLDEVTLNGTTWGTEVGNGPPREFAWESADFGLSPATLESLVVSGPEQSAELIRGVLAGRLGPARDIVVLNAAAALLAARRVDSPRDGAALAAEAIDSHAAADLLQRLVERTNA